MRAVLGARRRSAGSRRFWIIGASLALIASTLSVLPLSAVEASEVPLERITNDFTDPSNFGADIDIDGDFAVVGARDNFGSPGEAYVLQNTDGFWTVIQTLFFDTLTPSDQAEYGQAVAISGNNVVVAGDNILQFWERPDASSPFTSVVAYARSNTEAVDIEDDEAVILRQGAAEAEVFRKTTTGFIWNSEATLVVPTTITTERNDVVISPDFGGGGDEAFIAVGAPDNGDGSVYFYKKSGGTWNTAVDFTLTNPEPTTTTGNEFGRSLAADTDVLFVGHAGAGAVWVYDVDGSGPNSPQKVVSSTLPTEGAYGRDIDYDSRSGLLAVGAPAIVGGGVVYVMEDVGGTWTEVEALTAYDGASNDQLGHSVAIFSETIGTVEEGVYLLAGAIGADIDPPVAGDPVKSNGGAVYPFYIRQPTAPANKTVSTEGPLSRFYGQAVAAADGVVLVGDPFGNDDDGRVEVRSADGAGNYTVIEQVLTPPNPDNGGRFGGLLATDGNRLAVGSINDNRVDIYERPAAGSDYAFVTDVNVALGGGTNLTTIDLDGTTLVAGSSNTSSFGVYDIVANTSLVLPAGGATEETDDVAVEGDVMVVSYRDFVDPNGLGTVGVYVDDPIDGWMLDSTLTNPDTNTTQDFFFGDSVDLEGDTLAIAVHDSDNADFSGAVWIYEQTAPGLFGAPVKIKSASPGVSDAFGAGDLSIDTDIVVAGHPGQGNGDGLNGRTGGAAIIKRDPDTGLWSLDSEFKATDRNLFDQRFGFSVSITGGEIVIGAPWDDNENGERGGAAYTYTTTIPTGSTPVVSTIDSVTVTPGSPTVTAGATGISVADLPPTAVDGYGGTGSQNIVGTSLNSVDAAVTATNPSEILDQTTIGDLGLDGPLLESILLSDVIIDGGWDPVLLGTDFEGLPLQNVTLADAISTGNLDNAQLSTLDLSATPVGAIPVGAIAVASTTLDDLTLPDGLDWCTLLGDISPTYNCSTTPAADTSSDTLIDLAIQGTPVGAIPVGAIPIRNVPVGAIPVGAIPVGAIDIAGTPVGAIPVGAILIQGAPVGAIPVGAIPVGAIPVGAIPVGAIDVGSTPVGAIPVGPTGQTIGGIQLSELSANGGVAASPVGAIPVGAIDITGTPVGAIPVGAIPVGAIPVGAIPVGAIDIETTEISSTPVGAIPVGAIDIDSTPVGAIPVGAIPVGAIPVGAIPVGAIPVGAIPVGAIPVGAIPVGAIPVGAIDLAASPVGAIPVGAIPVGAIGTFVDCSLIDCEGDFTLADAQDAGALLSTVTIGDFEGLDIGITFGDLVGVGGFSEADLRAQIDGQGTVATLADFLTFDDMTLAELPSVPERNSTTLTELGAAALALITLADLLAATGEDEADLQAELTAEGLVDLEDLVAQGGSLDGMILGDLPSVNQPVGPYLGALSTLRLGDILDFHPSLGQGDVDWGGATLADFSDWQDVTLEELTTYNGTTIAELIDLLVANGTDGDLTFGDLLLALVGVEAYEWAEVDLGAIELDSTSAPITFSTGFEIGGDSGVPRTLDIFTTIPLDAQYVPNTATLTEISTNASPNGFGEPTVTGNQLSWSLNGVDVGGEYVVSFDLVPSLSLGTSTVTTTGRLAGSGVQATATGSVGVSQAFEPNDDIGDAGVITAISNTIYASHIASDTDVDLFRIDLQAGARLAVSLSDLPADYDLVVYGPPAQPVSDQPALRQLNPTEVPDLTLEATENTSGGEILQDVPLQDLPVIDISNNRDGDSETIDIASVRSTGTYYIQVSGYSGANSTDPYALYVNVADPPAPLACVGQDYQSSANTGTLPDATAMAGVNTLILVNQERLFGKYGTDANTALTAINDLVTYTNVTNPGLGVTAAIVPVDGDGNVRAAYAALDAASCEPDKANAVVREINRVVDDMRSLDPNTEIETIMMVGDDDIIPMARLADDTTIANESSYANTFLDTSANSYFGALVNSYFLSDEPYGDVNPIQSGERILYVTDVALGRLVETPSEIAGQVAAFVGFQGQLDPSTGFVTGYDFLDDGAQAVSDALTGLPDTTSVNTVINETWSTADVIAGLYPTSGDSPRISSINAHYDHYRALPADENAAGTENDLFTTADVDDPSRAGRLLGRQLHSMGCHGGMSVPDEFFPTNDPRALDWAQAYARQGATWVGNTGYGYGETEGVELSERLMALYTERLDGSVSAGEALFYAKQTYLGTQQAQYGAFDEKVLQQATFYGIPFYQLSVAVEPPAAPLPPQPTTVPVADSDLDLTTIMSDPSFTPTAVAGQGQSWEAFLPTGDLGVPDQQSTPYAPIVPTVSYDVSFVGGDGEPVEVAQGAVISALTTTDLPNVNPDLALPIVDDSDVEVEPAVADINTDPGVFVSSYETPEGPRQAVTSLLSTFNSTAADGDGTMRLFQELTLEVYYRDPANSADQIRPTFESVTSTIDGGVLVIEATVADDLPDNVIRVLALVVEDAGTDTEWTAVELVQVEGDRWSGSLLVTGTEIEYLVQAVDGSGNSALTTNKARLFNEDPAEVPPSDPNINVTVSPGLPSGATFYGGPVTVSASTDNGAAIDYQVDGGTVIVGGAAVSVPLDPATIGDGAHTVRFTSGEALEETTVLFDTTDPVATIVSPADGSETEEGEPLLISFSCADAASGIAACNGALDGGTVLDGTTVTPSLGSHTLVVTATDSVGNTDSTSVTFDIIPAVNPGDPLVIEDLWVDGVALPGEPVELLAEFSNDDASHTATIDWGDGTVCDTSAGDPNCSLVEVAGSMFGEVSATHTYATGGVYTVAVTITSVSGESVSASQTLYSCTIVGTNRNDVLRGTNGDDVICGLAGRDRLIGRDGNDVLIGGPGNDTMHGDRGDDILLGGGGWDRMFGWAGNDTLVGSSGSDSMFGHGGNDVLIGGAGKDNMNGGGGADIMRGNSGIDRLIGASGNDVIRGGTERDVVWAGGGLDQVFGGPGNDYLNGGSANDVIKGNAGNDFLAGGRGVDELDGGADNDTCRTGGGADVLISCES
ncbi:MAG: hypothetical protein AAF467_13035 [Actinomycetota bacterium]